MPPRPATRYKRFATSPICHPSSTSGVPAEATMTALSTINQLHSMRGLSPAAAVVAGPAASKSLVKQSGMAVMRQLSSVPGPLESRRRAGKRHMADIYSIQTFSPPEYNACDLSKWTWFAPTPAQKPSMFNKVSLMGALRDLLAGKAIDYANTVDRPEYADPLVTALVSIEAKVANGLTTELYHAAQQYNIEFANSVRLGLCRDEEIVTFTTRAFDALLPLSTLSEAPDILLSSLIEQTCEAMQQSTVGKPQDYSEPVWRCLYTLSLKLDLAATNARALALVMQCMPETYVLMLRDNVYETIYAIFSSWHSQLKTTTKEEHTADLLPIPHLTSPAAQILSRFSLDVLKTELLPAFSRALESAQDRRDTRRLHLALVSMVSQMPAMRQSMFLGTISSFFSDGGTRKPYVPDLQLCSLMIQQWASRGYLPRSKIVYANFYNTAERSKPWLALANLVITISRYVPVKQHVPTMMSLCEALRQQDRLADLVKSFDALLTRTKTKIHPKSIIALTAACQDASIAVALYKLARRNPSMIYGGIPALERALSWKMWYKYSEALIKMPSISGSELLTALELRNDKKISRTETYDYSIFIQRVLVAMACQPRFSVRQRLHYLDRGLAFLRNRKLRVQKPFIGSFILLILRDLRYGHLGRCTRIIWLKKLVQQYFPGSSIEYLNRFIMRSRLLNIRRIRGGLRVPGRHVGWYLRLQQTLQRRRQWRQYIFQHRKRVAIGYAQGVWKRFVRSEESWVLLKNHIRVIRAKLRRQRFRAVAKVKDRAELVEY
ncbi:hypothetical protein Cpir12675_000752 [Ceratocystis pirilliformis]|uniref:Uncharacterized protein n=1 Tax=Ceratocystis pirilliformis TaxID=259994 RepID=A0ABR3ZJZ5_9PEZI